MILAVTFGKAFLYAFLVLGGTSCFIAILLMISVIGEYLLDEFGLGASALFWVIIVALFVATIIHFATR